MKRAIRAFFSSIRPGFGMWLVIAGLCLAALVALLPEPAGGIRMTEALRLQVATLGFQLPDPVADVDGLRDDWQPVALPYASAPEWRLESPSQAQAATQLTWYRLQVPPSDDLAEPLYLFIPRWVAVGTLAIYVDGVLFHQSHANLRWNGATHPRWIALPHTTESQVPRELLVRVQHIKGEGEGLSSVWIGTHEELYARYAKLNFIQTQLIGVTTAAFLATGLFAFMIWLTRRSEPIYFLFFLMSLSYFLASMHTYVGENRLLISDEWFSWLTVNAALWLLCTFHLFIEQLHGVSRKMLSRTLIFSSVCLSLITVPAITALTNSMAINLVLYLFILVLAVGVGALGLRDSIRQKSHEGIWLASWGGIIVLSGFADWFMQGGFIGMENVFLTKHASVGYVLVFWYIMFRRYVGALQIVETAKENLALRLREREAELAATHERLREIERRQTLSQERQRLMQDMHDGLGSALVSALRVVEHGDLDEAHIAQVLKDCIDDLKLTIDSMEPVEADLLLLLATLRFRLAPRLESTGIALRWDIQDVPPLQWLTQRHSLHILRILQEAFANIIKHAEATEIRVSTAVDDCGVRVSVDDNGRGFDVAQAMHAGGMGLANQQRRARSIGASVHWNSSDKGTRFSLCLPL